MLALVVCCWRPAPADHIPGLPGPYPGLLVPSATGLTVDFSTEAELIAAISNDTIKVAHLVKNLRLEAKGWPLLPILRNTSFTISGDPSPYPYPILVSPERQGYVDRRRITAEPGSDAGQRPTCATMGFEALQNTCRHAFLAARPSYVVAMSRPHFIQDLAFIESKVQLAQDAVFLFKRVSTPARQARRMQGRRTGVCRPAYAEPPIGSGNG